MRFASGLFAGSLAILDVAAQKYNRAQCQRASPQEVATACPPRTILVGQNGQFKTIQSAVLSIVNSPDPYTILIQPGTYHEQVNVTRTAPLTLLGMTTQPNDFAGNKVTVLWKAAGNKVDNAYTSALTVAPTLDSSLTGSGPSGHAVKSGTQFGNIDFRAYNVDFVNDFKKESAGPSHAVGISYANAGFYYCGIRSYQDTLYVGKLANAFFFGDDIAGQTDFLYGFGTAWIQSSTLHLRNCGGGITAWKGTQTSFPNKYGVYIYESRVQKASSNVSINGKCSLGRPWNSRHRSIFAKSYLDASIRSSGYTKWASDDNRINAETFMAEYANNGPGFSANGRREGKLSKVLTDSQWAEYSSPEKVFQFSLEGKFGNIKWIDFNPRAE